MFKYTQNKLLVKKGVWGGGVNHLKAQNKDVAQRKQKFKDRISLIEEVIRKKLQFRKRQDV